MYLYAFYFGVTTMTTVGYGDISPIHDLERILGILSMFMATGVFSYSFSLIASLVGEITHKDEDYFNQMRLMN